MASDQSVLQSLMVTFLVVVLHEFRHRTTQRRLPDEYHPIQTLFFDRANEALGICIQIRRPRWQTDHRGSRFAHQPAKWSRVLGVAVDHQVALPTLWATLGIDESSTQLQHPRFLRSSRDSYYGHHPIGKTDHEQQIVSDQSPARPPLHREEIARRKRLQMRLQKRRPLGALITLRSRFNAIAIEPVGNRAPPHLMAKVGENTLNSRITPAGVVPRHADD